MQWVEFMYLQPQDVALSANRVLADVITKLIRSQYELKWALNSIFAIFKKEEGTHREKTL